MIRFLALLLFPVMAFGACQQRTLCTFEGGSDGTTLTVPLLNSSTVGETMGWTIPDNEFLVFSTSGQKNLSSAYNLCTGGTQAGTGTLGLRTAMPTQTTWHERFDMWPSNTTGLKASFGAWFMHTIPNNNSGQFDWFAMYGTNKDAAMVVNLKIKDNGGPTFQTIAIECIGCGAGSDIPAVTPSGGTVNVTNNTWYWIAGYYDATVADSSANCACQIYNDQLQLLGGCTNANTITHSVNAGPLILGLQQGQSGLTGTTYIYMDNITTDYTGTWPLLPQGNGSSPTYTNVLDNCVIRNFSSQ